MNRETEITVRPYCPDCGIDMWIPDDIRCFTCHNEQCKNDQKYKIPTIKLEIMDG